MRVAAGRGGPRRAERGILTGTGAASARVTAAPVAHGFIALAALTLAACGGDGAVHDSLVMTRDTVGDTIRVHIESGSVWSRPARLRKTLEIGALEGADEETFGMIAEVGVTATGDILVFDGQVPALRRYDADGRYLGSLGGLGQGPGEYGHRIRGLVVRRDGTILLRDMDNQRIIVYRDDGTVADHWRVESGLYTRQATVADAEGHVYVKALVGPFDPGAPLPFPWPIGLLHLDAGGALVDTVPPPAHRDEPQGRWGPLHPGKIWALHPDGHMVIGVNGDYAFEIRRTDGTVVRISKAWEPVPVSEAEHAEYERRLVDDDDDDAALETAWTKPAYGQFHFGGDGRIWVPRPTPSEPTAEPQGALGPTVAPMPNWPFYAPLLFDVFEPDGTYLGEVPIPRDVAPYVFGSDRIYGVRAGKYDELYVVRYALDVG